MNNYRTYESMISTSFCSGLETRPDLGYLTLIFNLKWPHCHCNRFKSTSNGLGITEIVTITSYHCKRCHCNWLGLYWLLGATCDMQMDLGNRGCQFRVRGKNLSLRVFPLWYALIYRSITNLFNHGLTESGWKKASWWLRDNRFLLEICRSAHLIDPRFGS